MELALDIVIIILIAVMIAYSVVLNIKLRTFRHAQNEMASLISQLNGSITQAQVSVENLKKAAVTEEVRLKELIIKARLLADELEIITQSGSNLADRIERGLVPQQKGPKNGGGYEESAHEEAYEEDAYEADHEMLETLKNIR